MSSSSSGLAPALGRPPHTAAPQNAAASPNTVAPQNAEASPPTAAPQNADTSHNTAASSHTTAPSSNNSSSDSFLGRGHRAKLPSTRLRDYVTNTIVAPSSESSPSVFGSATSSGTPYPLAHYINCNNFSVNYRKFLAALISTQEPRSFEEAMKDIGWRASMQQEPEFLVA